MNEFDVTALKRARAYKWLGLHGSKLLFTPCTKCGDIKYYHNNFTHAYFKTNLEMLEWYAAQRGLVNA